MQFEPLDIVGAILVKIEAKSDQRGFFARTFCTEEFALHGLPTAAVQASISYNAQRGTVRGMHFQWPPSQEGKLVRCIRGKLWMCYWISDPLHQAICNIKRSSSIKIIAMLYSFRPALPTAFRHSRITPKCFIR